MAYAVLILGIMLIAFMGAAMFGLGSSLNPELVGMFLGWPQWVSVFLLGLVYVAVLLMWGVMWNAFVIFPLMRHMAITTSLPEIVGLTAISQRARDEFAEAEGFAEALDLGAAI